jgi:cell fate (sporulation/competence/biofilm development) regulator YlbF (YheA/YmcA/DUF963 family)
MYPPFFIKEIIMPEQNSYGEITEMAENLSRLINAHESTIAYRDLLSKMKEDAKAQGIYARLVKLGKDLADLKDTGTEIGEEFIKENEALKIDLAESALVKAFVEAQKNYFEMMSSVQKAIAIIS